MWRPGLNMAYQPRTTFSPTPQLSRTLPATAPGSAIVAEETHNVIEETHNDTAGETEVRTTEL